MPYFLTESIYFEIYETSECIFKTCSLGVDCTSSSLRRLWVRTRVYRHCFLWETWAQHAAETTNLGCIKCPDGFKTFCLLFYFVLLIGRWRCAKCKGHRMPFSGSASASNIHHPPISARILTKCPKKHFCGHAGWQANVMWPTMLETLWPNMVALLWVLVPFPQPPRGWWPL